MDERLHIGQMMASPEMVIGHYTYGSKNVGLIKSIDTGEVVGVDNTTVRRCDEKGGEVYMSKIIIEMDYPETCGECKLYSEPSYSCHNERGHQAKCALGYITGDTRDRSYKNKKPGTCGLKEVN